MQSGIDLGYYQVKAVADGDRRVTFPSAVGGADRGHFAVGGNGRGIEIVSPQHVYVGEEAVLQSRFLQSREDRNWIESNAFGMLFLAAVTEITAATSVDLQVVTGLPAAFYERDAPLVKRRLLGEHRVQREGRRAQLVRVQNVKVIPQPFGSLLSTVLDSHGKTRVEREALAKGSVGIIDIGGKTTNYLHANGLRAVGHETTSIDAGGWSLVRAIRQWLADNWPGLDALRDYQIAEAIEKRQIRYQGELVPDFSQAIDEAGAELAQTIVGEATRLWNGAVTIDKILVTGGGSLLLGEHLLRQWKQAEIVTDPTWGNAVGYWKFARRLYAV